MPNDEPSAEADGIDSEVRPSAQPATVGDTLADASGSTSPPEAAPAQTSGEIRSESTEQDKLETKSDSTADESGPTEKESALSRGMTGYLEQELAQERTKDAKSNIDTRPPDAEVITFRSVIIVEIYVGQEADSLTTALAAIEWVNSDEPILDRIAEARKSYPYSEVAFSLVSDMTQHLPASYGLTSLPSGIDTIFGRFNVLGPAIVAADLTFMLTAAEAKRIDAALREDAESRLDPTGPLPGLTIPGLTTVRDVKRERVRGVQNEVIRRCLGWLNNRMPGTLSAAQGGGFYPPACAVVGLFGGRPFDTQAEYMALLDLAEPSHAEKFVSLPFLFLIHRSAKLPRGWMVAALNEADAERAPVLSWPRLVPVIFELVEPFVRDLMIVDGLNAALRSFEPRLRDVRADLNRLDIDKPAATQVLGLRNRLLGLSREISAVSGDVAVLLDPAVTIWLPYWALTRVKPSDEGMPATAETTQDAERRQLRVALESLQGQEVGLRELILITSSAMNETRTLKLSNTLNRLTVVLVVLTVVLVVLTVVQLA